MIGDKSMKRTLFFVALTVVSGLIGGMLGAWLLSGRVAEAQGVERVFVKPVLKARALSIVDRNDNERITLGASSNQNAVFLRMYDAYGRTKLAITIDESSEPQILLLGKEKGLNMGLSISDNGFSVSQVKQ
jgi:hypothetical protein